MDNHACDQITPKATMIVSWIRCEQSCHRVSMLKQQCCQRQLDPHQVCEKQ